METLKPQGALTACCAYRFLSEGPALGTSTALADPRD